MTKFTIQHNTGLSDRVFVALDDRFEVALIRTEDGLSIEVYPITDGRGLVRSLRSFRGGRRRNPRTGTGDRR